MNNGMRNDAVSETAFDAAVMIHSDPAAGNETPATAVDETMNKLAEHAGALAVSASNVGFLHLPGELRNQIYENIIASRPTLEETIAMFATSRVVRTEYMALYFKQHTVLLQFWELNSFLSTFIDQSCATIASIHTCKLDVRIDVSGRRYSPVINLHRLLTILFAHPKVYVKFQGGGSFNWEAESLDRLVEEVRSKSASAWHAQCADFKSIQLETNTSWHKGQKDGLGGYYIRRPSLEAWLELTPEAAHTMSKDKEEFNRQADGKLLNLDLTTVNDRIRPGVVVEVLYSMVVRVERKPAPWIHRKVY